MAQPARTAPPAADLGAGRRDLEPLGPALRRAFAGLVALHGLVHLLGAAEGLGWADVPQLEDRIGTVLGGAWLAAAVVVMAAGILLARRPRRWWPATAVAAVVSQAVIATSWADARAGTAVNVLMLLASGYSWMAEHRPVPSRPGV